MSASFMPPSVTTIAENFDNLYAFLLITSAVACLILIGGMIFFSLKYRRRALTDKSAYIEHSTILEFLWSFIPLVIFLGVFAWGWHIYHDMRKMPTNGLEVHVTGQKWIWNFDYKSGKKTVGEMVVPVNEPVKLILTSKDVIHSFFIPSMRIKQDAVPGRYTTMWFESEKLGNFQVFCTEFCGQDHSKMLAVMKVVTRPEYEAWLQEKGDDDLPLLEVGQKVYTQYGCIGCHSLDGKAGAGPTYKNIWMKEHEMTDGSKVLVDENYIRESILAPSAKMVKGYGPVMPSFQGQLSERQLLGMIEFIKAQQ